MAAPRSVFLPMNLSMSRVISHFSSALNSKNSYPFFSGNSALYDTCAQSRSIILPRRHRILFSSQFNRFYRRFTKFSITIGASRRYATNNLQNLTRSMIHRPAKAIRESESGVTRISLNRGELRLWGQSPQSKLADRFSYFYGKQPGELGIATGLGGVREIGPSEKNRRLFLTVS